MKMAKNSWRLAFTVVGVQVAIMAIVGAVFIAVAPNSRPLPIIVVSVFLGTIASTLIQKRLAS
jgi:hypothetical protein